MMHVKDLAAPKLSRVEIAVYHALEDCSRDMQEQTLGAVHETYRLTHHEKFHFGLVYWALRSLEDKGFVARGILEERVEWWFFTEKRLKRG